MVQLKNIWVNKKRLVGEKANNLVVIQHYSLDGNIDYWVMRNIDIEVMLLALIHTIHSGFLKVCVTFINCLLEYFIKEANQHCDFFLTGTYRVS